MEDSECEAEFSMKKCHIPALADVLQIPDAFKCYQGSVCEGIERLCILLRPLSYPCRFSDLIPSFCQPVSVLHMITNKVLDFSHKIHSHRMLQWNHGLIASNQLQTCRYADTVRNQGAAVHNCFGFVDGTVRPIARPGEYQRILYNGHKRVHGLTFQSLALPNRIIANMFGPIGKQRVLCLLCLCWQR